MRKTLSLGVVIAALGLFPAAAQAHHLEQNTSTAACVLVNNQPIIQVRAHYVQFVPADQPIHYVVRVDNVDVQTGDVPLNPLPDFFHPVDLPSTPGSHTVLYSATWNSGANGGYFTTTPPLTCPTPVVPPTVICNGVQVPAGTVCTPPPPVVICNGVTMPTTTPPATCAKKTTPPKKKPPTKCVAKPLRLKVYPLRQKHGEVEFVVSGVKVANVRSVHWYVRRTGHPFHRVGTSGKPWEHITHHGLTWHIYLWVEKVWGYPQWSSPQSPHHVQARLRVKTTCGVVARKVSISYPNQDPEPRARGWN
jgi:hypothetical protein